MSSNIYHKYYKREYAKVQGNRKALRRNSSFKTLAVKLSSIIQVPNRFTLKRPGTCFIYLIFCSAPALKLL